MKKILITGASSGIGHATALAFAKLGFGLVLIARRRDRLEAVRAECLEKGSPDVRVHSLDLQDSDATLEFFRREREDLEAIDVLVNNAGLALGLSTFQDSDFAAARTMLRTNVEGAFAVVHGMLPYFLARSAGHIVQIGSVAGRWTYPKGHVYCASKAALKSFNEALRLDLLGKGIRVTEIAPGMVETDFSRVRFGGDEERAAAVYAGMDALSAADIAETIVWVSSRPAHVNVQELVIYPTDQASPGAVHRK